MATKRITKIKDIGTGRDVADISVTLQSHFVFMEVTILNNMGPMGPLVQNNGLDEIEWT